MQRIWKGVWPSCSTMSCQACGGEPPLAKAARQSSASLLSLGLPGMSTCSALGGPRLGVCTVGVGVPGVSVAFGNRQSMRAVCAPHVAGEACCV